MLPGLDAVAVPVAALGTFGSNFAVVLADPSVSV